MIKELSIKIIDTLKNRLVIRICLDRIPLKNLRDYFRIK